MKVEDVDMKEDLQEVKVKTEKGIGSEKEENTKQEPVKTPKF